MIEEKVNTMNHDYIKSFDIGDRKIIYNYTNGTTFELNKKVFDMIKNCDSKEQLLELASSKSDSDKEFLESLANTIEEKELLKDCRDNRVNEITYIVTEKCNLSCKHCCMSAKPYRRDIDGEVKLSQEILEKIIAYDPQAIIITGGEPLIASNFIESLIWLRKNFEKKIILSTNAILIDESNAKIIADNTDVIDISLDGTTEESSDYIRGKGTFNKVMKAVELLNAAGAKKIRLSNALPREESENLEEYSKLCQKIGVEAIVRDLTPTGRALENNLSCKDPLKSFLDSMNINPNICGAGTTMISVLKNGDVFPCNNFSDEEFKIGNILDENFQNELKEYRNKLGLTNFARYFSRYRPECKECEVSQYCWTCPFEVKLIEDYNGIKNLNDICSAKKQRMIKAFENE